MLQCDTQRIMGYCDVAKRYDGLWYSSMVMSHYNIHFSMLIWNILNNYATLIFVLDAKLIFSLRICKIISYKISHLRWCTIEILSNYY